MHMWRSYLSKMTDQELRDEVKKAQDHVKYFSHLSDIATGIGVPDGERHDVVDEHVVDLLDAKQTHWAAIECAAREVLAERKNPAFALCAAQYLHLSANPRPTIAMN